ncbi:MAG TPA: hypothetical protein VGO58_10500 [Chitinophagaceae bacterium]|jgi:hypothetical protein|nr:hypothetical protein [Chitinophagaceae bacterium]
MKKHVLYVLAMVVVLAYGCKKEESFEVGNTPSQGSLQSDVTGDCLPKTVNGTYVATTPLVPATNTITIQVNVTRTGTYLITTDTVNGYFFRATGTFTTLGNNNVTLRSNGTPFAEGTDNFVVSYNGTICDIAVDVLPAGAGGPATFTLVSGGGPPANCASAAVSGVYVTSTALNASNYVDIQVNVTQIGTYSITATGGGMTFSKLSAAFLTPGVQTVRLAGSGTAPATGGPVTVTFAAPLASCSFTVTVTGQAVYTIDCAGADVNGTYTENVPLDGTNTIVLDVLTVTTPGAYSITASINGMTFSGSGTLTTAPATITLTGTGTPSATAAPTSTLALPAPLSCSIPITVVAGASIDWSFKVGATTYQGSQAPPTSLGVIFPPFTLFHTFGDNPAGETIQITLTDATGGINVGETYKTINTATNSAAFSYNFPGGDIWEASPPLPPDPAVGNMTFTITAHNTTTKTISGTFSGIAKNLANADVNITEGTFTIVYP